MERVRVLSIAAGLIGDVVGRPSPGGAHDPATVSTASIAQLRRLSLYPVLLSREQELILQRPLC